MAGFLHNGLCYPSQLEATSAYYGDFSFSTYKATNTNIFKSALTSDTLGNYFLNVERLNASGNPNQQFTIALSQPSFPDCELTNDPYTNFLDGMQLGWGVATAMILVYVIRRPYR